MPSCTTALLVLQPSDRLSTRLLDVSITLCLECFVILSWHGLWTAVDVFSQGHGYLEVDLDKQAWFSYVRHRIFCAYSRTLEINIT